MHSCLGVGVDEGVGLSRCLLGLCGFCGFCGEIILVPLGASSFLVPLGASSFLVPLGAFCFLVPLGSYSYLVPLGDYSYLVPLGLPFGLVREKKRKTKKKNCVALRLVSCIPFWFLWGRIYIWFLWGRILFWFRLGSRLVWFEKKKEKQKKKIALRCVWFHAFLFGSSGGVFIFGSSGGVFFFGSAWAPVWFGSRKKRKTKKKNCVALRLVSYIPFWFLWGRILF
jgi:hypothetical protein